MKKTTNYNKGLTIMFFFFFFYDFLQQGKDDISEEDRKVILREYANDFLDYCKTNGTVIQCREDITDTLILEFVKSYECNKKPEEGKHIHMITNADALWEDSRFVDEMFTLLRKEVSAVLDNQNYLEKEKEGK